MATINKTLARAQGGGWMDRCMNSERITEEQNDGIWGVEEHPSPPHSTDTLWEGECINVGGG